jgi:uncharacterized coiled-coil DUF342 family protein
MHTHLHFALLLFSTQSEDVSIMSGVGGSVRDQLLRLQSATDQLRHARDAAERESTNFSKNIQDLKVERHKLSLEKQEIQEKLARFSNEETWLEQQRERMIRQKEEDKKALVASARESEEAEKEEKARRRKFCEDMKQHTDNHETLLYRASTMRMKALVCSETANYLVANIPQVATKEGPFTPDVAERLQSATKRLNQATLDRHTLKAQHERLVDKLLAFRKQALSLGFEGVRDPCLLRHSRNSHSHVFVVCCVFARLLVGSSSKTSCTTRSECGKP